MEVSRLIYAIDKDLSSSGKNLAESKTKVRFPTSKIYLNYIEKNEFDTLAYHFFALSNYDTELLSNAGITKRLCDVVDEEVLPQLLAKDYQCFFWVHEGNVCITYITDDGLCESIVSIDHTNESFISFYEDGLKYIKSYVDKLVNNPSKYGHLFLTNYNHFYDYASIMYLISKALGRPLDNVVFVILASGRYPVMDMLIASMKTLRVPTEIMQKLSEIELHEMIQTKIEYVNNTNNKGKKKVKTDTVLNQDLCDWLSTEKENMTIKNITYSIRFYSFLGRHTDIFMRKMVYRVKPGNTNRSKKDHVDVNLGSHW